MSSNYKTYNLDNFVNPKGFCKDMFKYSKTTRQSLAGAGGF